LDKQLKDKLAVGVEPYELDRDSGGSLHPTFAVQRKPVSGSDVEPKSGSPILADDALAVPLGGPPPPISDTSVTPGVSDPHTDTPTSDDGLAQLLAERDRIVAERRRLARFQQLDEMERGIVRQIQQREQELGMKHT
jgi:hypothetical protein